MRGLLCNGFEFGACDRGSVDLRRGAIDLVEIADGIPGAGRIAGQALLDVAGLQVAETVDAQGEIRVRGFRRNPHVHRRPDAVAAVGVRPGGGGRLGEASGDAPFATRVVAAADHEGVAGAGGQKCFRVLFVRAAGREFKIEARFGMARDLKMPPHQFGSRNERQLRRDEERSAAVQRGDAHFGMRLPVVAEAHLRPAHRIGVLPDRRVEQFRGAAIDADARRGNGGFRCVGRRRVRDGPETERSWPHGFRGDAHARHHDRIAIGPDPQRAGVERRRIAPGEDGLIIVNIAELVADAPEAHAIPCAMDRASGRDQRLVAAAHIAIAGTRGGVGGGGGFQFAVAEEARIKLRKVRIPAGGGDRVAVAGGIAAAVNREIEVARPVLPSHAHASIELHAEIAGQFDVGPETGKGVRAFAVHVGPGRLALEAVDDLPGATVDRPVEQRLVEERVEHVFAPDQRLVQLFQAEPLDARPACAGQRRQVAASENGVVARDPEQVILQVHGVELQITCVFDLFRRNLVDRHGEGGVCAGGRGAHGEEPVADGNRALAIGFVFGDGEVQHRGVDHRQAKLGAPHDVAAQPCESVTHCDPLSFGRGPMAHERIVDEGRVFFKAICIDQRFAEVLRQRKADAAAPLQPDAASAGDRRGGPVHHHEAAIDQPTQFVGAQGVEGQAQRIIGGGPEFRGVQHRYIGDGNLFQRGNAPCALLAAGELIIRLCGPLPAGHEAAFKIFLRARLEADLQFVGAIVGRAENPFARCAITGRFEGDGNCDAAGRRQRPAGRVAERAALPQRVAAQFGHGFERVVLVRGDGYIVEARGLLRFLNQAEASAGRERQTLPQNLDVVGQAGDAVVEDPHFHQGPLAGG